MATIKITKACPFCHKRRTKEFDSEGLDKWRMGVFVQYAFPNMTPDDREFLITGICEECWV